MDYAKPLYTIQEVNAAGRRMADVERWDDETYKAVLIIDNWRAAHAYPLNSFHITLKNRVSKVCDGSVTAQRIKRLESIAFKLVNEKNMKLSQMQDIGGCRAVLQTIDQVYEMRDAYVTKVVTHVPIGEKDYIADPRPTGYRGVHLKYRFSGKANSKPWNGLKIEIQLRTFLQHKWATAVEAAGTFTQAALKSNRGKQEWLRFFALMSSIFAIREGCPTIPGTPGTLKELCDEIRQLDAEHQIKSMFTQYSAIIPHIEKRKGAKYFLVTLNPTKLEVNVQGYKSNESQLANKAYTYAETMMAKDKFTQVVLVSVSSINTLKRAYPNYFLDTQDFLRDVSLVLDGGEEMREGG
jgi:hypothetical protein